MASIYGFEVETDFPFQRFNRAPGTRGSIAVEASGAPLSRPGGEPTSCLTDDSGRRWYASYELDGECLLEMPPTASFLLRPAQPAVLVEPGRPDPELLEHRVASGAICTLLAMRGDLVLHAAAVLAGERCVLLCGPSGRGKSTLALALGEAGLPLLGEDGIAIDLDDPTGPRAYPGARGVRVRGPGGRRRETRLAPDPGREPGPAPVAAVVMLGERGERLAIEPAPAAKGLAILTSQLVHSGGRDSIAAAFAGLATLLGSVPAFSCELPDDLGSLPGAARIMLDTVLEPG